ncbi:MAG: hypothetical protein ACKVOR_12970 [Flavobacteriales bacterium]
MQASTWHRLQSPNGINYLNIGLMLASTVLAFLLPFELFLFSYAVLGPLHYLTELSWLEKKSFFVTDKKEVWLFVILAVVVALGSIKPDTNLNQYVGLLMMAGFLYALCMLVLKKTAWRIAGVVFIVIVMQGCKLNQFPDMWFVFFGILLPTIIHVFLFTGAFILFGALKSRSFSGLASLVVFLFCCVLFFVWKPALFYDDVSTAVRDTYRSFHIVNFAMYKLLFDANAAVSDAQFYTSAPFVAIMRFIAFAYTYHYLNWFSKTSVIKWNDVSKTRMALIVVFWLLSVGLFLFDYKTGLLALLALSLIHVLCEFPLNHITFAGIYRELRQIIRRH